jgi:hypothetical protein
MRPGCGKSTARSTSAVARGARCGRVAAADAADGFVTEGGEPRQVVDPEPHVDLTVVALACSAAGEAAALAEAVRERAAMPFDLAAAPPLRFTLFELGAGRHALLRVWHHVLGDALSARVLQRELSDAYATAHAGRDPALAPLAIDFLTSAVAAAGGRCARRRESPF